MKTPTSRFKSRVSAAKRRAKAATFKAPDGKERSLTELLSSLWKVPVKDVPVAAILIAATETARRLRKVGGHETLESAKFRADLCRFLAPDEPEENFRITSNKYKGRTYYYIGYNFGEEVTR